MLERPLTGIALREDCSLNTFKIYPYMSLLKGLKVDRLGILAIGRYNINPLMNLLIEVCNFVNSHYSITFFSDFGAGDHKCSIGKNKRKGKEFYKEQNISMNYGKIIKDARIKQGISQKKLAEAIGATSRAVIYWENGQRKISLECADKIFRALHMRIQIGEEGTEDA